MKANKKVKENGITPAWAGKSRECRYALTNEWDHPRVGGEKQMERQAGRLWVGSPPRRQGKANWHCVRRPALRITPAHAGKRTRSWRAYGCPWDHPRVGGEKSTFLNSMSFPPGSPPRRRGKVPNARCFIERQRITPAWAGKSAFRFQSQKASQDHPRVGGEKALKDLLGPLHVRITPAWAGKSPASQPWSPPLWMMVIRPRP